MIINTKDFKEVAATLALAVNDNAANLELVTKDNTLRLNVTNKEYFCSKIFNLDKSEDFHAVVDAQLFLDFVAGITTETFELTLINNAVQVKAGKSKYKFPMIYENDVLAVIPQIKLENILVSMNVSNEILQSILNVNSKEIQKVKNIDVNELQKLYYIDESGCFTFSSGACLNSFTLEKPVKLLLNDRIVKLFKLFKTDVSLTYGVDALSDGSVQPKVIFATPDTYLAAIINCDDLLLNKIQGPCAATKNYIKETYTNHVVLSVAELAAAISRLMLFTKNSITGQNMRSIPATITFTNDDFIITDAQGNTEAVAIKSDTSYVDTSYQMILNVADLKLVLDSCKCADITLNCGNHRSVVITRANISNLLPESRKI